MNRFIVALVVTAACAIFVAALGGCAAPVPVPAYSAEQLGGLRYKAVLVAGDDSADVFDNAVNGMAAALEARGVAAADIVRLSARPGHGERSASLAGVVQAIAGLHAGTGQGCLVFVTSHGTPGMGLVLSRTREYLTPGGLDAALSEGCGPAPTVVVASGCYSGTFAAGPMQAANRIVLTAARADRPSFGCRPGRQFTYYDRCLLGALDQADWAGVQVKACDCVTRAELAGRLRPSEPQLFAGSAVASLPVPAR